MKPSQLAFTLLALSLSILVLLHVTGTFNVVYFFCSNPRTVITSNSPTPPPPPLQPISNPPIDPSVVERKAIEASSTENLYWQSVVKRGQPEDYEAYLKKYPNGQFAELAQNALNNPSGTTLPPDPDLQNPETHDELPKKHDHFIGRGIKGVGHVLRKIF